MQSCSAPFFFCLTPHWHNSVYLDRKDHLAEAVAALPTAV